MARAQQVVLVLAALAAACAPPPLVYQPHAALPGQPAKDAAAVALAENKTMAVEQYEGHHAFNPTMTGWTRYMGSDKLTDYIVQDLSASGLFSSVVHKGEGEADVEIRPIIVKSVVKDWGVGGLYWNFDVTFRVYRSGRKLFGKRYVQKWHTGAFAGPGAMVDAIGQNVALMMDRVRKDLSDALAGRPVIIARPPAAVPTRGGEPAEAASPDPL